MLLPVRAGLRPPAPTPLSLPDLTALTRRFAAEVRAGRYPVAVDPQVRRYRRLLADDHVAREDPPA